MLGTAAVPLEERTSEAWLKLGQGNWAAFSKLGYDFALLRAAAARWADALSGITHPWLCWKVDEDWCLVQQKLVQSAGWTPVVGYDPRVGPPKKLIDGALVVNFNEGLDLPILYPHFPLEFVCWFTDRLAFWHSDLLLPRPLMTDMAARFKAITPGQTIATRPRGLSWYIAPGSRRYWELLGCTTRLASQQQFDSGCGWWRPYHLHPNFRNEDKRPGGQRNWDHGAGIYYWQKHYGGNVTALRDSGIFAGHFTKIGNKNYKHQFRRGEGWRRLMGAELTENFQLRDACAKVGLSDLL